MKEKIAFQGEYGSNSHILSQNLYPDGKMFPCQTFEDALSAVKTGKATYGVIPIENTLAGRVADVHHLLPPSELHIVGEHFMQIRFHLLGLSGATLADVTDVYSHVHALGQCKRIFKTLRATAHVTADTAGAAKMIQTWNEKTKAAIAPEAAAEIYHLEILEKDVQDNSNNITRFVILAPAPEIPPFSEKNVIISLFFRLENIPTALFKALGGFADSNLNIIKLESYMERDFMVSAFYLEVEGRPEQEDFQRAITKLSRFTKSITILGVYPSSPFRRGRSAYIL